MSESRLRVDSPLESLKGIGPRRAEALAEAGLVTVEDLLRRQPFRYEDRRSFLTIAELGEREEEVSLQVRVVSSRVIRTRRRGFSIFEAILEDDGGSIRAVWYNQPYLLRQFSPERRVVVFGRPSPPRKGGDRLLENPDWEFLSDAGEDRIHTGRIVPVYRKVAGLTSRVQRSLVRGALEALDRPGPESPVPAALAGRYRLMDRSDAFRGVHFPSQETDLRQLAERTTPAHRTLAFEDLFLLQAALGWKRRAARDRGRRRAYRVTARRRKQLEADLPFRPTDAQSRVFGEIVGDLLSPYPMNRLLQGDVGSGKTAVAALAMRLAAENGYQAALMAPTEVLAEQHHRNISELLGGSGDLVLLTGSVSAADRRERLGRIATGRCPFAVGTHALFEKGVRFRDLGLAVVDEQHRFGVVQRASLAAKGERPDLLVMSATPIPRSLALTVYGDLDVSTIDRLPPGRQPVKTVLRRERDRDRVYRGLRQEVEKGRQAFIVVPLVEDTGRGLKSAVEFAEQLRTERFAGLAVGLLHGRMKGAEKEAVMAAFKNGGFRILVSTTVVEVGVDVPNATVMVVEHAERFGLSQLHQLRGRVGRGSERSYCILMTGKDDLGRDASDRLAILAETTDGFRIAEKDLEMRGPGAVFGTDQHGAGDLQLLLEALRDRKLLEAARREASAWVEATDPGSAEAAALLRRLRPSWKRSLDLGAAG